MHVRRVLPRARDRVVLGQARASRPQSQEHSPLGRRSARRTTPERTASVAMPHPADGRYGGPMSDAASLTREEARERAELISVDRYDVEVDLRAMFEGDVWASTSTISFT